jgi:hypothetical protein
MSRCQKTHLLDAAVAQETPDEALREHAEHCPRCRHELNWLETERKLFRERAAREEVEALWQGTMRRSPRAPRRALRRAAAGFAAAVLIVVGAGRVVLSLPASESGRDASVTERIEALMTENAFSAERAELCSRPEGIGFHCGGYVLASR